MKPTTFDGVMPFSQAERELAKFVNEIKHCEGFIKLPDGTIAFIQWHHVGKKKPCAPTATTTEKAHPPQAILSFSAARSSKASE